MQAIREHGHHDTRYVPDKADASRGPRAARAPWRRRIAQGAGDINRAVRRLGCASRPGAGTSPRLAQSDDGIPPPREGGM